MIEEEKEFEQTIIYSRIQEISDEELTPRYYPENYKKRINDLIDSIKEKGVNRSKKGIRNIPDDILIDVSRDGELLFVDGRHRLSIAKILGIDKIPVRVLVRHEKWVKKLEREFKNTDKFLGEREFPSLE